MTDTASVVKFEAVSAIAPGEIESIDYAALALLLGTFTAIASQTGDPIDGVAAAVLLWAVLSWAPSRAALVAVLRKAQGR